MRTSGGAVPLGPLDQAARVAAVERRLVSVVAGLAVRCIDLPVAAAKIAIEGRIRLDLLETLVRIGTVDGRHRPDLTPSYRSS